MTPRFDARATAAEVVTALSILDIGARSATSHPLVAQIEPTDPDHHQWIFLLTPRGWSTLHSRDGVGCEPICGFVDSLTRDAAPSLVALAIRRQLVSDALVRAAGDIRYLPRCAAE